MEMQESKDQVNLQFSVPTVQPHGGCPTGATGALPEIEDPTTGVDAGDWTDAWKRTKTMS
ncbi:hypothetical protein E4U54_005440 [Claviceps lovelessii]|nr:hypothetical protein E4U54_005440 [Claviceps lovelessii]